MEMPRQPSDSGYRHRSTPALQPLRGDYTGMQQTVEFLHPGVHIAHTHILVTDDTDNACHLISTETCKNVCSKVKI